MWLLKFEYSHKDCMFSKIILEKNLIMYGYPINYFEEKNKILLIGLQILSGKQKNIDQYIRKTKKVMHIERVSYNTILFRTKIKKNIDYYKNLYNNKAFYQSPIIHKEGMEIFSISSWDRKVLSKIIKNIQENKNTTHFRILRFQRTKMKEIFIPQILDKLTRRQREIVSFAKQKGYFDYPKKITLQDMAKQLNVNKSTLHEIIRRAESRIMNFFI